MFSNMMYNKEPLQVCYKCDRFLLSEYPNYKNKIYQNQTNINEIVTIDCSLCASLETNFQNYDEKTIYKLIENLKPNQQLLFITSNEIIPNIISENFEFAGFDISDDTISTSILTNTIGDLLVNMICYKDLTQYGLIKDKNHAINVCKFILKNYSDISHCENPKIIKVYRAINNQIILKI